MPKVSVILNTFDRPYMLKQAIASVLAQTLDDWELIIAVDHQKTQWANRENIPDKYFGVLYEARLASEQQDRDIHIDYTDLEPGDQTLNRFAHNINRAFRLCTGEYITYLCDDDLLMPWKFTVFSQILDENPDIQIVYGKQMIFDVPSGKFTGERGLFGITNNAAGQVNHNSPMHRRHCFETAGGWNENAPARFGDAYFWQRLNQHWPFYPLDCVGEIQRMGDFNCWSGKPQSDAERANKGAFA